jgi:hypothetical protein
MNTISVNHARRQRARMGGLGVALAAVAVASVLAAGTADAGRFGASTCSWPTPTAVFQSWNDFNLYYTMSGGTFEDGAPGWAMSGGANIDVPNEPAHVHGAGDGLSLGIPNGGSVTTSTMCVTSKTPALRFFATNSGASDKVMQVFVNYTGTDGKPHSTKLPDQKTGNSWSPLQRISFVSAIQTVLNTYGQAAVTFTFKVPYQTSNPGNWRIDDVYLEDITGICDWPTMANPFTAFGDSNPYFAIDGGTFENGAAGWTLPWNAAVDSPNEPWNVNGANDANSLYVPNGGSVTSARACVTAQSPALRLFYVNTGGADRVMQVFLNYTGTDGKPHSVKLADQTNSGKWAPSSPIQFLSQIQNVLTQNGQTNVTFTFTVPYQKDRPGNWRIDDVEIDPIKNQ